ncbi:MAG: hypothetical protein H3C50_09410 [Kiritimatiellae bacterium]|nr:hypothetical protein [Kiritimatiellia bacterium]MCO5067512.1 thrombospondin type 3 repeat-containing protein [Kiritimatiellia bacterium]
MGSAKRPGGSWFEQNYDKLALVVILVILLLSALLLVLKIGGERKEFDARYSQETSMVGAIAKPLDVSLVSNLLSRLSNPFQVQLVNRSFMVGEERVASIPSGAPIPFKATVDPFNGTEQPSVDYDPDSDGDGIPDKAEAQIGLNPADPTDARADLDGDGYSNLEEYQAGTDPRDPASFPPPAAKLRLVRTVVNPFKLRFLGISRLPDGDRYQLNLRTLERTYFARVGEVVEGFKVLSYDDKATEGPTLTLEKDGSVIRLIQGRVIDQDARTALVIFLVDGSRFRVQIGDDVRLKDLVYKVVDIREDRVVIREQQTGKQTNVGLLTTAERTALQGGSSATPEPVAPSFP